MHKHSLENHKRHLMFDHEYLQSRLKSRKSFRTVESLDPNLLAFWHLKAWNKLEAYPNEAIQPPIIRITNWDRPSKKRHLMFDHEYLQSRLKSRKSFRTVESLDPNLLAFWHLKAWNKLEAYPNEAIQPPIKELPTGTDLQRKDWVLLNRARAKVGKMT